MPKLSDTAVPGYCRHKGKGLAYVTLDGRDIYLGKYGTPESRAEYSRLIAEWLAAGRRLPVDPNSITIAEVVVAYKKHAQGYYRRADGTPTNEAARVIRELTPLTKLYAKTPAVEFGPLRLKAVRDSMVKLGWVRSSVNHAVGTIKRCFRYAAENELLPASVFHALATVQGLKQGRTDATESEPVMPAPMELVEAAIAHVLPQVATMIRLQLLTGMRSGEMVVMTTGAIDRTGTVWIYKPEQHKTKHHGHVRQVYLGPKAQAMLAPYLKPLNPTAFIFDPRDAVQHQRDQRHEARKTPMNQGNKPGGRRVRRPVRQPGKRYSTNSYGRAITRACDAAFPPPAPLAQREDETPEQWKARLTKEQRTQLAAWQAEHRWHPHQLRHNFATEMRKEFGVEATLTMLGDKTTRMVDVYAEKNLETARSIMSKVG